MASTKTAKRDAGFPLSFHKGSRQWCKKVKGKVYYFGTDRDAAAKRWFAEKDAIYAGTTPKSRSTSPRASELANVFIAAQRERNEATGKPGRLHIGLCESTLRRFIDIVGADCVVGDLSPDDYAKIKTKLFKPVKRAKPAKGKVGGIKIDRRAPETVAGDVRRIKTFLNWCHDLEHIPEPRFGNKFAAETKMAVTKESLRKDAANRRDFAPSEIDALIGKATPQFRPLLWLAINAGIGNRDAALIEWSDISSLDGKECWIDLPRLKTGAHRRFVLWPETQEAIKAYLPMRSDHASRKHADRVFLTSHGVPWVRGEGENDRIDSICTTFYKLRDAAGIGRGSFYDLRRTFQTVAAETLDFPAVSLVMGHAPKSRDMAARYTQRISDDRIRNVCEHVRAWLFGGEK